MSPKIRIAIIIGDDAIMPWHKPIVDELADGHAYELVRVFQRQDDEAATRRQGLVPALNAVEGFFSRILFRLIFRKARRSDAQPAALAECFADVEIVPLENRSNALRVATQGLDLDVIVNLAGTSTVDTLASEARLGTWSLQIGQQVDDAQRFLPPGLREVCRGAPTTHVALMAVNEVAKGAQSILEGAYRTFLWSWHENARQLQFKASVLMIDGLRNAFRGKSDVRHVVGGLPSGKADQQPVSSIEIGIGLLKCWWRIGSETTNRVLREEKWNLFIAPGTPLGSDLRQALLMEGRRSSYWADPFPMTRDGRQCVFFEEYPYATRKGIISVADYEVRDGQVIVGPVQTVIEQETHVSYPFLLEMGDDLYMIPETNADRIIGLWRCAEFPGTWHKVRNLMEDVSATDTSLVQHDGRWWMFTNIDRSRLGDHCSELHVFHADDPLSGEWIPHAMNPVVRDSRSARMAGPLTWSAEEGLIRPAQVNERYYGSAVTLQRITQLDPEIYEEECVRRIDPNWRSKIYRNHHIAPTDGHVVIDACHNQFKLPRLFFETFGSMPFGWKPRGRSVRRVAEKLTTAT